MNRLRNWARRLGLGLAGVAAAFVVFEVGSRISSLWFPYFYCYDPDRGWGLKPGVVGYYGREGHAWMQINHDGFRGADLSKEKPPDTIRIAVMGDSYTEAMQVPYAETFCAVAERRLAGCPVYSAKKIQVLDFGVDGYGTEQELITLDRKAWAYSPDIVVLAVFLGNDIRNNSVVLEPNQCRPFAAYRDGELVGTGPFFDSKAFRLWCMTRFEYRSGRIPALLVNGWEILFRERHAPTPESPSEPGVSYSVFNPPADEVSRDAWRVTEALITAMRDDAVRHGAKFVVVTLDTGIQVWPDKKVRERFMKRRGIKNLFYAEERIEALGRSKNFEVLALAPALQKYADEHHAFLHGFSNTPMGFGHWNTLGHRLAGDCIAQKLCEMASGGPSPATPVATGSEGPRACP